MGALSFGTLPLNREDCSYSSLAPCLQSVYITLATTVTSMCLSSGHRCYNQCKWENASVDRCLDIVSGCLAIPDTSSLYVIMDHRRFQQKQRTMVVFYWTLDHGCWPDSLRTLAVVLMLYRPYLLSWWTMDLGCCPDSLWTLVVVLMDYGPWLLSW